MKTYVVEEIKENKKKITTESHNVRSKKSILEVLTNAFKENIKNIELPKNCKHVIANIGISSNPTIAVCISVETKD
jgi:hypothetical protein